ncbi:MAG: flagellar basal body P-ring formation chaperone FlgA [bacterium]
MKTRNKPTTVAILALLLGSFVSASAAEANRMEEQVSAALEEKLTSAYPAGNYRFTILPINAAAHLKPCTAFAAEVKATALAGRVPVHVRCLHPANWSLYASAEVEVAVDVITTRRAISRGELILAGDLNVTTSWLQQNRRHQLTAVGDAVGKIARRALRADTILTAAHLEAPLAVDKGERVRIIANSGRVSITAYGTALSSGRIGEQIQVRNDSSARVIRPWIIGPGEVGTSAPGVRG